MEFVVQEGVDLEEVELELIDGGLEELDTQGEHPTAYGEYTAFGTLTKAVEDLGLKLRKLTCSSIYAIYGVYR